MVMSSAASKGIYYGPELWVISTAKRCAVDFEVLPNVFASYSTGGDVIFFRYVG